MMFSAYPFSTRPFSSSGRQSWAFFDSEVILDVSFQFVVNVATSTFATRPSDALPSQLFRGRLERYTFNRSIMGQRLGQFTEATGRLTISNADAYYDFLPQSYTFDARPIALKVTQQGASFDVAYPLGRLTAHASTVDLDELTIELSDYGYLLDVPMQPNLYSGAGGKNGGDDLQGKRVPLAFGPCNNVSPPQLNTLLIYQVHDGVVNAIAGVFDRGVALTPGSDHASYALLAAATVAAGAYDTCLTEGLFRLGSAPSGLITADVQGEATSGYITRTADIVRWALANRTTLTDPDDLDTASFAAVNLAQPATVSYWIGPDDSIQVSDFVANLMGGIGGGGGHNRAGLYRVWIFVAPAGNPVQRLSKIDILGDREPQRSALPSAYNPPPWRWRVPYARVWTVQTDLAGAAGAARKAMVAEPYRLASAENAAVKVDHPTAQDPEPVQSFFAEEAPALAEAQRLLDLFRASRQLYTVTLPRRALRLDLASIVLLTFARFDLSLGKLMTVVAIGETVDRTGTNMDEVKVTLYG